MYHVTLTFLKGTVVYFIEFPFPLGLSGISSQLDSDYALLAGIPQKRYVLFSTSYQEIHDVDLFHGFKIRHKFNLSSEPWFVKNCFEKFHTHSRFPITDL